MVKLAQAVAGLMLDLGEVPPWYTARLNTADESPDNTTVFCRVDGGRQRSQGSIGNIRAAARVVDGLRLVVNLVLDDEAGEIAISISNLVDLTQSVTRDTLAEVKAAIGARLQDAPMEAIAGLRVAQEEIGSRMEALSSPEGVRACVGCHCTDEQGCEAGCWWVGDKLCSTCLNAFINAAFPRGGLPNGSTTRGRDYDAVARILGQGRRDGAASDARSGVSAEPGS